MGFYEMSLSRLRTGRFDHVRINSPLRQPVYILQFFGFCLEHFDKGITDNFPLLFRVIDTGKPGEKQFLGISTDHMHAHVLTEGGHHLIAFFQAQQAVIDEDTGQLIAYRFVKQCRHHRRIDATGKPQQHLIGSYPGSNFSDGIFNNIDGCPQGITVADLAHKPFQNSQPLQSMSYLRVKLNPIERTCFVGHGRDGCARRGRYNFKIGRHCDDLVTMTHPYIQLGLARIRNPVFDTIEQSIDRSNIDPGEAKFRFSRRLYFAAKVLGHGLHAVADTKNWHPGCIHIGRWPWRFGPIVRFGTTGKYNALGCKALERICIGGIVPDFTIDPQLANASRDELSVLGTKIQNQNLLAVNISGCHLLPYLGSFGRFSYWTDAKRMSHWLREARQKRFEKRSVHVVREHFLIAFNEASRCQGLIPSYETR